MQRIYIVIESDKLFPFKEAEGQLCTQYIQGKEFYEYSLPTLGSDFEKFVKELENEFNCNSSEFSFVLVLNPDANRNNIVRSGIQGERINANIEEEIAVDSSLMKKVIEKLSGNEKLFLDYGVNFDGRNYVLGRKDFCDFSLLGYTITPTDIVKCLKN
jgi:hypothetical protein